MKKYIKKEKIKYLDVDNNNKLTNKAIINYMQNVAGEHADINGDGLATKDKTHIAWLVLNWKIKVFSRPQYGEKLTIKTWVKKEEHCCFWREFEIYCNKELIAIGDSRWASVNTESFRISKVPTKFIKKYSPNGKGVFTDELKEKIREPKDIELMREEVIGRTKLDTNNHLNNLYYLEFAIESLPENVYTENEFSSVEIMYKKQVKYKEKIKCFYTKQNDEHIILIKSEDEKNLHALVKFYN